MDRRRLESFEVLTFDCYGTLIDWESGILKALRPLLKANGAKATDEQLLELYAELESKAEAGAWKPYRAVLKEVVRGLGLRFGFPVTPKDEEGLPDSLKDWEPFPDTVEALHFLKKRYRLSILSNVDKELFAATEKKLGVAFDLVVTAEEVRSYKPAPKHFLHARELLCLPFTKILHVAQSLHHDIATAKVLGLSTVWVNRRQGQSGATPVSDAAPDLEVPDLRSLMALLV